MLTRRRLATAVAACFLCVVLPLGGGALGATSSGANGDIVFVRGGNIYLVSNTSGPLVSGATDPSWSPDGLKLVYVASGVINSCTVSNCGGTIVTSGVSGSQPVWSPDGTKLAYVLTSSGQIHTMAPAGTGDVNLGQTGADPSWSPDGSQIVFTQGGAIARMPSASAGSVTTITTTGVSGSSQPAWSPDGSSIAFQSSSSGHSHIYVVSAPAGGSVTQVTPASSEDETAPSWSPDSTAIVYANASHGIESVTKGTGGAWQAPVARTSTATDLTPDWQTVAPIAVSAPSITGGSSPQTGQLLSATNGSWSGASTFAYQWRRCDSAGNNCSDIGGANSSSYAVVGADVGGRLRVVVTAANPAGSTASAPSNATGVVTAAGVVNPPVNTAYPAISFGFGQMSPLVGSSISAGTGTWSGSFPMTFAYQWKWCDSAAASCFDIKGATSSFYTVPAVYYGKVLRVQVTATNSAASVSQNSEASPAVTAVAPVLRATPQIVGQNVVDQTLSLTAGTWDGTPAPTLTYSWRRCNPQGDLSSCVPIEGATASTYDPTVADIGFAIRAWITGSNPAGADVGVANHTYPIVDKQHFAPSTQTHPSTTGALVVGEKLSADMGTYNGDAPIATKLAWQRCDPTGVQCVDIPRATKTSYSETRADIGSTLRLAVTATNAYGTIISLSEPSDPVLGVPAHCRGRRIRGATGDAYIIGTRCDDVIHAGGGNDTINGEGGYDTIYGGRGHSVITVPGPGSSRIFTGSGSDTVYAANGYKDTIVCGSGRNKVFADPVDIVTNCTVVVRQSPSASAPKSP